MGRRYSAEERAMAVEIAAREGGTGAAALHAVRMALDAPGLSKSTLHGWISGERRQQSTVKYAKNYAEPAHAPRADRDEESPASLTPQELASMTLDAKYELIANRYLDQALRTDVVQRLDGKELITSAAIATDKMRLLRNLPNELVVIVVEIVAECDRAALPASAVFQSMLQEIRARMGALPRADAE